MRVDACAVSVVVFAACMASAVTAAPQAGMKYTPLKPAAAPAFSENVLEMTPATVDRFGKALAAEEAARKTIAAKAAAPAPQARLGKEQYQQCQMNLVMSPEYLQLMQQYGQALGASHDSKDQRKATEAVQTRMNSMLEKQCGPDPSAKPKTVDVSAEMRKAQENAAQENGFSQRQYAILKERIGPLCLSDDVQPGPNGLQLPGEGRVFYVYTSGEVEAVRPRCEAFVKALYPNTR
jgi:hypothetical protein